MPEKKVGTITHFYGNIGVVVLKLEDDLKVGDKIHLLGHGADFKQNVDSMQVEHQNIESAKKGDAVGMKVEDKVKPGTQVFLVKE